MKKNRILVVALLPFLWASCSKKEQNVAPPLPGNEALTTMIIRAVNISNASDTPSARWEQLDLTGATPVNLKGDTLRLRANATYNVTVTFMDSLTDITKEISSRADYHIICFDNSMGLNLAEARTDLDSNKPPLQVGLKDLFVTGPLSNGTMTVTLHHQPNVKDGTCNPGSIDMNCNFYVEIE